jgi:hypothetical protein
MFEGLLFVIDLLVFLPEVLQTLDIVMDMVLLLPLTLLLLSVVFSIIFINPIIGIFVFLLILGLFLSLVNFSKVYAGFTFSLFSLFLLVDDICLNNLIRFVVTCDP